MRPRRRALFPLHSAGAGACGDPWADCQTPPPVPSTPDSGPGPSPSLPPYGDLPCPPVLSPSPAPAHNGRRNQGGTQGYGAPPGAGDHDRRHLVKYALIAAGVFAFVCLILLGVSVAVRRRQVRRRRQALLAPPPIPEGAANVGGGGGHDHGWDGAGGVVHHVWNIRTVGLDEASISSIAATRYRAGAGLLGAADCSVCLGEFQDGELVRLLPKCAHAFHVPCIDTWLRAHVNCPVCRSDVLDPAVTADSGGGGESSSSPPPADPDASPNGGSDQVGLASDAAPDHEGEESGGLDASPAQEDQQERPSSAQPLPPPPELLCALPRNVRRAASMDAVAVSTAASVAELDRLPEVAAPEEEQIGGRRKRWTGPCPCPSRPKASGSGHRSNLSTDWLLAPSGVPRSFFSRHSRARSSVLPL